MFADAMLILAQADSMNGTGWGDEWVAVVAVAFTLGGFALVVWQLVKVLQTRIATSASVEFQVKTHQLAEASVASQASTARELSAVQTSVAEISRRLGEIERLMKDVG